MSCDKDFGMSAHIIVITASIFVMDVYKKWYAHKAKRVPFQVPKWHFRWYISRRKLLVFPDFQKYSSWQCSFVVEFLRCCHLHKFAHVARCKGTKVPLYPGASVLTIETSANLFSTTSSIILIISDLNYCFEALDFAADLWPPSRCLAWILFAESWVHSMSLLSTWRRRQPTRSGWSTPIPQQFCPEAVSVLSKNLVTILKNRWTSSPSDCLLCLCWHVDFSTCMQWLANRITIDNRPRWQPGTERLLINRSWGIQTTTRPKIIF